MFKYIISFKFIFVLGILIPIYAQNNNIKSTKEIDTNIFFFPSKYFLDTLNTFGQEKNKDFYKRRMQIALSNTLLYSQILTDLKEPKIFNENNKESYRFLWIGYFGTFHNPISIRIEKYNNNIYIISKYFSKNRKLKNGILIANDTIPIDNGEWKILKTKIDSINFWNFPLIEKTDIAVYDGSMWILEGINGNLYNLINTICGEKKEIEDICLYLLKLSKIKVKRKEFY